MLRIFSNRSFSEKAFILSAAISLMLWVTVEVGVVPEIKTHAREDALNKLKSENARHLSNFQQTLNKSHGLATLLAGSANVKTLLSFDDIYDFSAWPPQQSIYNDIALPTAVFVTLPTGDVRAAHFIGLSTFSEMDIPTLLQKSRTHADKAQVILLNNEPWIVADSPSGDDGYVLIATHIDEYFLYQLGFSAPGSDALITVPMGNDAVVLASSNSNQAPVGSKLSDLSDTFLISGKEYFDNGESGLTINLSSIKPLSKVESLVNKAVTAQKNVLLISILAFALLFIVVARTLALRVQTLHQKLNTFLDSEFSDEHKPPVLADEIDQLEHGFIQLKNRIKKNTQQLEQDSHLLAQLGQLNILDIVTNQLGVGVLRISTPPEAINLPMKRFSKLDPDLSHFIEHMDNELPLRLIDKDGLSRSFKITSLKNNEETYVLVSDVSAITHSTETLQFQAMRDSLTGLANRTLFNDRLRKEIDIAKREAQQLAILIIDLDRFKEINDTMGHQAGDVALCEVAARFLSHIRPQDTLARLGGDEFAVIMCNSGHKEASRLSTRLGLSLDETIYIGDQPTALGVSIGISIYPDQASTAGELLQYADIAMYQAKKQLETFCFYEPEQDEHSQSKLDLNFMIREGISRQEFIAYYQPQVDLQNHTIYGVEALVRWQHPYTTIYAPGEFLQPLDRMGLMNELTCQLLERIVDDQQKYFPTVTVSVNIMPSTLKSATFWETIMQRKIAEPMGNGLLTFELVESDTFISLEETARHLISLRHAGAKISIDDFGTGYSSLMRLNELPFDELKIDQSFIHKLINESNNNIIVKSTIEMARSLGMNVIAEGVENTATIAILREYDCQLYQGYYFLPPSDPRTAAEWIGSYGTKH